MSRQVYWAAGALFAIVACSADDKLGQVDLALTGTSASGVTYRLRNAELTISGVGAPIVLHTEDDPTRTLIDQELDVGSYNLQVAAGWRLERLGAGGSSETVAATLESPNPQGFAINSEELTSVVLRFRTQGEVIELAPGHVGISIDVADTFASCAEIHASLPASGDGVYTIARGAGTIQVFCDMTHGGVTYEQLAFGNSNATYAGYAPISLADLNDPVLGHAFVALYNLQGSSLINIDMSFVTNNCGIKPAGAGTNSCLHLGGDLVLPADLGNSSQCIPNYPAPAYRFILLVSGPIPSPLPVDYFATHPATTQAICSDSNNPAWFFKRS